MSAENEVGPCANGVTSPCDTTLVMEAGDGDQMRHGTAHSKQCSHLTQQPDITRPPA